MNFSVLSRTLICPFSPSRQHFIILSHFMFYTMPCSRSLFHLAFLSQTIWSESLDCDAANKCWVVRDEVVGRQTRFSLTHNEQMQPVILPIIQPLTTLYSHFYPTQLRQVELSDQHCIHNIHFTCWVTGMFFHIWWVTVKHFEIILIILRFI